MLNHRLNTNDGYGVYESLIASQANSSGVKRLILVTIITISFTEHYYKVIHNDSTIGTTFSFEDAREIYNNIY